MLIGTPLRDIICGLAGADQLEGGGGDDLLLGGEGDDVLTGGAGSDCLIGGPGEDRAPDAGSGDHVNTEDHPDPLLRVDKHGECRDAPSASPPPPPPPPPRPVPVPAPRSDGSPMSAAGGEGPVAAPLRAASILIALSRAFAAERPAESSAFPVSVARHAAVRDGKVRFLLLCAANANGQLIVTTRGHHRHRVARTRFACTAPSTVVMLPLRPGARAHLARSGTLETNVRVVVGSRRRVVHVLLEEEGN